MLSGQKQATAGRLIAEKVQGQVKTFTVDKKINALNALSQRADGNIHITETHRCVNHGFCWPQFIFSHQATATVEKNQQPGFLMTHSFWVNHISHAGTDARPFFFFKRREI